jgi:uncharacterized protein YciI
VTLTPSGVRLRPDEVSGAKGTALPEEAHERFIDSLIARHLVLLRGSFAGRVGSATAAYVLRCDSVRAAREIAAADPVAAAGAATLEFVEWHLVGIDPEAIDPSLVV